MIFRWSGLDFLVVGEGTRRGRGEIVPQLFGAQDEILFTFLNSSFLMDIRIN